MRSQRLLPLRRQVLAGASGLVLELGIGSGLNLPLYGPAVQGLVGVDPSMPLLARARKESRAVPFCVHLVCGQAEALPFPHASFDCAVSTWCLCSFTDPLRGLAEIRRILKPGAPFLFVEHGRHPEPGVAAWQDRLTPLWARLTGGCHLNRNAPQLLKDAGFAIDEMEAGRLIRGPGLLAWQFKGAAH
jgi:ubiquinone/menaquinone biosynthesis C-methylase UbiE